MPRPRRTRGRKARHRIAQDLFGSNEEQNTKGNKFQKIFTKREEKKKRRKKRKRKKEKERRSIFYLCSCGLCGVRREAVKCQSEQRREYWQVQWGL